MQQIEWEKQIYPRSILNLRLLVVANIRATNTTIIETSVKENYNVQHLFHSMVRHYRWGKFNNYELLKNVMEQDVEFLKSHSEPNICTLF